MKWLLIVPLTLIALMLVLWFGARAYYHFIGNDGVADDLQQNPNGERAEKVMLLTMPGGEVIPVNYLKEGSQVFVGADGGWWKTFQGDGVAVDIFLKGEEYSGRARTVLDDPEYKRQVFERLRPSAPSWLPDWLNAQLVVIDLDE